VALESGRWDDAAALAGRIVAVDQHDLFAQRLVLAARERSASLRLAVDDWLEDRFCPSPFEEIEVRADGAVNMCCSAWLPPPIGVIEDGAAFWNSPAAAEIRRSVLDGDFSYCSRLYCPKITTRSLPRRKDLTAPLHRAVTGMRLTRVDHRPRRVVLSEDRSCNLSCPSCRRDLIQLGPRETERLDRLFDEHIEPILDEADRLKVTGSGDPFGSRHFRHVLARLTARPAGRRRIELQTNGVLFDERAWIDLCLEGHVSRVLVSVDAADPDTYAVVRRGGSFDRLVRNLAFLGRLRAEGRIDRLRLDFVVQAANFREMPAFVDLARRVGADGVYFLRLRNWGTFSADAFNAEDVVSAGHPEHPVFLAVLGDPRLARPFVDFGDLSDTVRALVPSMAPQAVGQAAR
jgi:hypothetical protein